MKLAVRHLLLDEPQRAWFADPTRKESQSTRDTNLHDIFHLGPGETPILSEFFDSEIPKGCYLHRRAGTATGLKILPVFSLRYEAGTGSVDRRR